MSANTMVVETPPLRRGTMPPLHARDVDERYQILEGAVLFYVGDEVVRAGAGDTVVAHRNVPRTFRVESDDARWLVLTSLRSLARYDDFTRAVARPLNTGTWPSAEELAALEAIAAANGITILGPPGLLPAEFERAFSRAS